MTSPIRLQGEQCAHMGEWNRKKKFPSVAGTGLAALWEVISEGGMGTPRCWWPSELVMVPEWAALREMRRTQKEIDEKKKLGAWPWTDNTAGKSRRATTTAGLGVDD